MALLNTVHFSTSWSTLLGYFFFCSSCTLFFVSALQVSRPIYIDLSSSITWLIFNNDPIVAGCIVLKASKTSQSEWIPLHTWTSKYEANYSLTRPTWDDSKMKFQISLFFCLHFVAILNVVIARPQNEGQLKTKQSASKTKRVRLSQNSLSAKTSTLQVSKQKKGPARFSPAKLKKGGDQKRQFIARPMGPMGPLSSPFVLMRRPPLTQRTIVTTHIPRPPMPVPYNGYNPYMLPGSLYGRTRFPFRRFHHGYSDIYEEDEEDDEGSWVNWRWDVG